MPTGYKYSQKAGRWLKNKTEQSFDYESTNLRSGAFLISFFRWYPDYMLDLIESPTADFKLELPERLMLRAFARYNTVFITGSRGIAKTYCATLARMVDGILFPGEVMRYNAPSYKQCAELASVAFRQIEKNYPTLTAMWRIESETKDSFKITTAYGSEFSISAIQGGNCSSITAEEIGQETAPQFNFLEFESKILPTCRIGRKVNRRKDTVHLDYKKQYITNASRRQNPCYYKYRAAAFKEMDENRERRERGMPTAFACDFSWEMSVITNIRDIPYIEDLKTKMTVDDWQRQMCAKYTGTGDNPIVRDETLAASKTLTVMEDRHCGEAEPIYVVAHDVSYEDGAKNAKCADVVLKLTRYTDRENAFIRRGKYRKQVVYADAYPPPKTDVLQAQKLKDFWFRYCLDGGNSSYIVVDTQAYGKAVVEELMKPPMDGLPPLCCWNHVRYAEIEQPHALPIIYPLKAGARGAADAENDILRYAQLAFEQGEVELLTSDVLGGVEQYKRHHRIKDDYADGKIILPYTKTLELCEQIQNLKLVPSGIGISERRISKAIQRDIWSALKYALWFASILEKENLSDQRRKSSWDDYIKQYTGMKQVPGMGGKAYENERDRLLSIRGRNWER